MKLVEFRYGRNKGDLEIIPKDSSKLKPCPFCGGEASLSGLYPTSQYYVECKECHASVWGDRVDKAQGIWNRRPEVKA